MLLRKLLPDESSLLEDFLYDAIFIPEGMERPPRDIIYIPALRCYFEGFGRKDDHCLVAEVEGRPVGAVWTRVFSAEQPGFGFCDAYTPEVSMSVINEFRNQGIGTSLLTAMLDELQRLGYARVSLSVDMDNYAYRMYRKFGFEVVGDDGKSAVMVREL